MPTFICFLNWTDQGAKNAKEANKRFQASKSMAEKLGGKLLSAYVTTTGRARTKGPFLGWIKSLTASPRYQ
jgi:uncharacterized protein with GYD domain